jgi:hypothetical protein
MRSRRISIPVECSELEGLMRSNAGRARFRSLASVEVGPRRLPIVSVTLGPDDPTLPLLIVVGGIHGLERIGARVVLSYLATVLEGAAWDRSLQDTLTRARMLFLPIVNPGGIALNRRSNPRGVDLMRNAPSADSWESTPLVGGHRYSRRLPWYRGPIPGQVEVETQALFDALQEHAYTSRAVVAVDVHSGFGLQDRLWFPYARTREPIEHLPEFGQLFALLDHTHPNHWYRIEPQAQAYTISGDLWDHLYDGYRRAQPEGVFLPLTLEMGSWLWVKKNLRQLASRDGPFNPKVPHRERRIRRRHFTLLDFLWRCVGSPESWAQMDLASRTAAREKAFARWYSR